MVYSPSTNRDRCRVTSLMRRTTLFVIHSCNECSVAELRDNINSVCGTHATTGDVTTPLATTDIVMYGIQAITTIVETLTGV